MLKISLIISLIGFVMFLLALMRAGMICKTEFKDSYDKGKTPFIYWLRMSIMFLIPLVNIFLLMVFAWCFVFASDKWYKDKIVNEFKK